MGYEHPKSARLLTRHDYTRALRSGDRIFTSHFIVYALADGSSRPRLGVTISRKVGGAVVRNRIRRHVREAFRTHPEWFRQPLDLVVIVKRPRRDGKGSEDPASLDSRQVTKELRHAIHHAQRRGAGRRRAHPGGAKGSLNKKSAAPRA